MYGTRSFTEIQSTNQFCFGRMGTNSDPTFYEILLENKIPTTRAPTKQNPLVCDAPAQPVMSKHRKIHGSVHSIQLGHLDSCP